MLNSDLVSLTVGAGATRIVTCETRTKSLNVSVPLSRKVSSVCWLKSVSELPWKNRSSGSFSVHSAITSVSQAAKTVLRVIAAALHDAKTPWSRFDPIIDAHASGGQ